MKNRILVIFVCLFTLFAIIHPGTDSIAMEDETPPVLEYLEVSPREVNGGEIVTFRAKVTDELSGVDYVALVYMDPFYENSSRSFYLYYNKEEDMWIGNHEVGPYEKSGKWVFNYIYSYDRANNNMVVREESFPDPGGRDFIVNNNNEDTTPPILESLEVSPREVNEGEIVTFRAKVTDELSGVDYVALVYMDPFYENSSRSFYLYYNKEEDMWIGNYEVGPYEKSGKWVFNYIYSYDRANNNMILREEAFPAPGGRDFIVNNNNEDTIPPILESLEVSPSEVNEGEIVTFRAKVTDELSGVDYVALVYMDPFYENSSRSFYLYYNKEEDMWIGNYEVGPYEKSGKWIFSYIYSYDRANNNMIVREESFPDPGGRDFYVKNVDTSPPPAPIVNTVDSNDTTILGSTEAGSTVKVSLGDEELGTTEADQDGKFTITIPIQKAGTVLKVTATDKSGNVSSLTEIVVKEAPLLTKIIVNQRIVNLSINNSHNLNVTAYYSDGMTRDITSLATYSSSNLNVATVDGNGAVIGRNIGQSNVTVSYKEKVAPGKTIMVSARVTVKVIN